MTPTLEVFFFFQCSKGKIESGENPKQAAIREAEEELGLFIHNIKGEIHKLGVFLGRTTFFVAEIKDKDMFGDPHFETSETKWMTPEEFEDQGRVLHKPVVRAVVRFIKKHHKIN